MCDDQCTVLQMGPADEGWVIVPSMPVGGWFLCGGLGVKYLDPALLGWYPSVLRVRLTSSPKSLTESWKHLHIPLLNSSVKVPTTFFFVENILRLIIPPVHCSTCRTYIAKDEVQRL